MGWINLRDAALLLVDADRLRRVLVLHWGAVPPFRDLVAVAVDPHDPVAALGPVLVACVVCQGEPTVPRRGPEDRVNHMFVPANLEGFHRPVGLGRPVHAGSAAPVLRYGGGER